jgi:hypothetical protein
MSLGRADTFDQPSASAAVKHLPQFLRETVNRHRRDDSSCCREEASGVACRAPYGSLEQVCTLLTHQAGKLTGNRTARSILAELISTAPPPARSICFSSPQSRSPKGWIRAISQPVSAAVIGDMLGPNQRYSSRRAMRATPSANRPRRNSMQWNYCQYRDRSAASATCL